jgi:anaerobic magnesium-protoporphyrin IX monomethyl ester cyclase
MTPHTKLPLSVVHVLGRFDKSSAPSGPLPKVVLVRGPIISTQRAINNEATPSIAFAYLSSYLIERGYEVTWVDGIGHGLNRFWMPQKYPGYQCQGLTFEEIVAAIPPRASIIGVSTMFSGEWPIVRDLIHRIREAFPEALLVAGGEHITAMTEYSLRDCTAIDVCVRGEGEHSFFEVIEAYRAKRGFENVAGAAFLTETGDYREPVGVPRIKDIDNIPWPYWPDGYLEAFWSQGKSYGVLSDRDMPMIVSRGCPYKCTFCSNPSMWTTRYSLRQADDVIAEIKHYIQRYQITAVQLYDLTAITKRAWAIDFCKKLLAEGIKLNWSLPSGTRSEALDDETLGLLKATGCNYLVYAPESGSPRVLEKIKKQISLDKLTASAVTAKHHGLVLRANLIIGFPGETRTDVAQTVLYGLKLAAKGVDEVSINIFSPYPGTEIFSALEKAARVQVNDNYFLALTSLNSDYSATNPMTVNETMGPRELAFYRLAFMLFNYILGYILYPGRIIRTLRNVFAGGHSTTVLEHRLKDLIKRKRPAQ